MQEEQKELRAEYTAGSISAPARIHPGRVALAVLVAGVLLGTSVVVVSPPPTVVTHDAALAVMRPTAPAAQAEPSAEPPLPAEVAPRALVLSVRPGDSLARLFDQHGLSRTDLHAIARVAEAAPRLRRLMPGDRILVAAEADGSVRELRVALDEVRSLILSREADGGFSPSHLDHPLTPRLRTASGEIESSLFASAGSVGLSNQVTAALTGIFGYDIDYLQDLRVGDRFSVVYEELWRDGEKVRDGAILAAEFVNAGRVLRAVRFEHPDGSAEYYAPDGTSMRKALTRNPIDFTRISSRFSTRRAHPILNKVRAHKGVDYAAPTGTPVRAAGDGKVVFVGVKGGYGKVVIIQHGATFSTLYAHLSRFGAGIVPGSRVRQDQVIGRVGQTGLATAPHLHYEVLVNGVHRNPRTVSLPDAAPVPPDLRETFAQRSSELLDLLPTAPADARASGLRT